MKTNLLLIHYGSFLEIRLMLHSEELLMAGKKKTHLTLGAVRNSARLLITLSLSILSIFHPFCFQSEDQEWGGPIESSWRRARRDLDFRFRLVGALRPPGWGGDCRLCVCVCVDEGLTECHCGKTGRPNSRHQQPV